MGWKSTGARGALSIDWRGLADRCVDPYLIWAELSRFKGVAAQADAPRSGRPQLRVALELDPADPDIGICCRAIVCSRTALYATALIDSKKLPRLLKDPRVKRLEIGFAGALGPATSSRGQPPAPIGRPVVAVIDFGCAFAHERFRCLADGRWTTRIAYLWDQGAAPRAETLRPTGPWQHAKGYGRELCGRTIDALLLEHSVGGMVDETTLYRDADYGSVSVALTHGTHVLDLAAGAPPRSRLEDEPSIIFVQLPAYAVDDTSGGSMVTHVLDAFDYILERAGPSAPVVINLSYGSMAGPHDGSTIIESVMDALIDNAMGPIAAKTPPNRYLAIVLPAGNNFESDGHALVQLDALVRSRTLQWQVLSDDITDTFFEVWYPRAVAGDVEITVTPPNGRPRTVLIGETATLLRDDGSNEPICAVIHRRTVTSGPTDAMALVALSPTRSPDGSRCEAPAGIWHVELALAAGAQPATPIAIHAWIERDDPAIGSGAAPRQSRFLTGSVPLPVNEDSPPGNLVQRSTTCNSIANGARTIVVGACLADRGEQVAVSRYTSEGPTRNRRRRAWPDLVASSDDSRSLGGVLAAGTRSGIQVRMNGTSVAAPQVAAQLIRPFLPAPMITPRDADDAVRPFRPPAVPVEGKVDRSDKRRGRGRLVVPKP